MRLPTALPLIVFGTATLTSFLIFGWYGGYLQPLIVALTGASQIVEPPAEIADDHFALGEYYYNQFPYNDIQVYDLNKARHHYEQSIVQAIQQNEPVPEFAWYQLARIDFVQGRLMDAISKLEQQLAVYGDSVPQTYYMLGLAYGYLALETESTTDWQHAETSFEHFMTYAPEVPWTRVDLAWVYFSQGKYEEMLPLLEQGLEYQPDHAWLLNTYGLALLNTGSNAAARAAFQKARDSYEKLSVTEWGQAYSGNDPQYWNRDFALFGETIVYNLTLVE